MNDTVLVGVHDSPAAFAAAAVAIEQARRAGARLRAVAVVEGGDAGGGGAGGGGAGGGDASLLQAREQECAAALAHVVRRAEEAGVAADSVVRHGRVAAEILAEAVACGASVIVLGRMDRPGHVIPAIGSHTLGVIEFAHVPVLVVPEQHAPVDGPWRR